MNRIFLIAFVIFFTTMSSKAFAALEIVITEGINTARPIGIVPFRWEGTGTLPGRLADIIGADLRRSGKFNPISAGDMPQFPGTDADVDYAAWAASGIEIIVVGKIEQHSSDRYLVTFELIDVIRGQITGGKSQV